MNFIAQLKLTLPLLALATGLAHGQPNRDLSDFNLQNGVGHHGYDPVAVFPEGGGQAQMGNEQIKVEHLGVIYFFASEQNAQIFLANPSKYESSYGGYCAYAMANGCKVDIDPTIFTIKGDRIHYFVSNRAKRNFDAEADLLEARADVNFEKMHGLNLKLGECLP